MNKLAIISSHPIQYYAPWFRYLVNQIEFEICVFYLWDFGVNRQVDPGFQTSVQWDIPLLEGYEYKFIPNTSSHPGTRSFWGLQNPELLKRVKAYHPDAVLMMAYNYVSLYRFLVEWPSHQVPILFRGDSHRLISRTGLKETIRKNIIRLIYQRFSAFLYVGQANYHYFQYHGVNDQKLFFSPHAIDNDRFTGSTAFAKAQARAWKDELGIPIDHTVILFAGKFELKKRPFDLCNAFIQAQLKNTSLLFVGTGPLEEELKRYAGNYSDIYFAPFQNQSLMPRTYAIADLFVLPSYGPNETWGLAVNEAMCMGCPIIVSDHVGCAQDLVFTHQNGMVFEAGNVAELSQALQKALSDPQQLVAWGKQSIDIISKNSYASTTKGLEQALTYLKSH